jgi:hypothetical protein
VPALRRAIEEIVRRHQILRAGFLDTAAGPKGFIRRRAKMALPVIDLATSPAKEMKKRLEEVFKRDAAELFDLERPPLLRTTLVRLGAARHILLVTLHHIIADQESLGVFRRELATLYGAFSRAVGSPLSDLPFQFADFARWQGDLLKSGALKEQITYWQEQLAAPPAPLQFHRGRRHAARYRSARRSLRFDDALLKRVRTVAREQNCTPFMILLAALDILLHHFTGANDIRIGTLTANRGRRGTAELIGYFVNALVLRARIQPGMNGAELMRQVRETCVSAYAHQDLPFAYLESLLDDGRRTRPRPLYQVMLNYRSQFTPTLEANGLTIASWDGEQRAADPGIAISRLDLNFHLRELPERLTGVVEYKTDLFDENAITRLLRGYRKILAALVKQPNTRIDAMTL